MSLFWSFRSRSNDRGNNGSSEETELQEKRKAKQTKFAWLARFLGMRPSAKSLEDKGILGMFLLYCLQ